MSNKYFETKSLYRQKTQRLSLNFCVIFLPVSIES